MFQKDTVQIKDLCQVSLLVSNHHESIVSIEYFHTHTGRAPLSPMDIEAIEMIYRFFIDTYGKPIKVHMDVILDIEGSPVSIIIMVTNE